MALTFRKAALRTPPPRTPAPVDEIAEAARRALNLAQPPSRKDREK